MKSKIHEFSYALKIVRISCIAFLLVITACKKNNSAQTEDESLKSLELKNWYSVQQAEIKGAETLKGLVPIWQKSCLTETANELIYEVELENTNKIFTTQQKIDSKNADEFVKRSLFKLVIIKDKRKDLIYGGYMNIVADIDVSNINIQTVKYKNVANFTGHIKFYTLDGALNNGWHYMNGKIDQSYNGVDLNSSSAKTESYPCGSYPRYGTICWDDVNCSKSVVGYDIIFCNKSLQPDLGDGGNIGGSGGGFTPRGGVKPRGADFGIDPNCRNCKISNLRFPDYLEAVKKAGLNINAPIKRTITITDGITSQGEITEIYDDAGNLYAAFFTPDTDSDLLKVGIYYNLGNGTPSKSTTDQQQNSFTYVGSTGLMVTSTPTLFNGVTVPKFNFIDDFYADESINDLDIEFRT